MSMMVWQLLIISIVIVRTLTYENNTSKYCEGANECANSTLEYVVVECLGYKACYFSNITADTFIGCDGYYGCTFGHITSYNYIDCSGIFGCAYSIVSGKNNIPCNSGSSCYASTITIDSVIGDIICDGANSCENSVLNQNSNGNIQCNSYYSCYYSVLTSIPYNDIIDEKYIFGSIYCSGDYACNSATILKSINLYCNSKYSCIYSTIYNTYNISVSGEYGLEYSDIYTNGINLFNITLSGYYSGNNGILYCETGTNCIINCKSETACDKFKVYCFGDNICESNCNSDCQSCPTIIYDNNDDVFNTVIASIDQQRMELKLEKLKDYGKKQNEWKEHILSERIRYYQLTQDMQQYKKQFMQQNELQMNQ